MQSDVRSTLSALLGRGGLNQGLEEPAPRSAVALSLAFSLAGLGISVYLTVAHFVGTQALVCSDQGLINCAKVTTSAQSHFLGMPVAVLGLAFYLAMTAITVPPAWRSPDRRLHVARLAMVIVGMAFALYLVSAELIIIDNICIWCTAVHAVTFVLFVTVVATTPRMLGWGDQTRRRA
ncbi:MAG TPA: vitamin K epoxide reductase family protein [Acidimicrobiales bacterium]